MIMLKTHIFLHLKVVKNSGNELVDINEDGTKNYDSTDNDRKHITLTDCFTQIVEVKLHVLS